MIRHRDVVLSPEEAARFDDDQRENLRSWGIGVPEPTYPPDPDEPPLQPYIIKLPHPNYAPFTSPYGTAYPLQSAGTYIPFTATALQHLHPSQPLPLKIPRIK